MMKYEVTNEGAALVYLTDCTLATVSSLAAKKSRGKLEFERQIGIAQSGIGWIVGMGVPFKGTRVEDVVNDHNNCVRKWAAGYLPA